MCIKCEIKKGLAAALGMEEVTEVLGTVQPFMAKRLEAAGDKMDKLRETITAEHAAEMDRFEEELKAKIAAKYQGQFETIAKETEDIQDEILAAAGISVEEIEKRSKDIIDVGVDVKALQIVARKLQPKEKYPQGVH
jgi:broad-specificity NMP kinase